MTENLSNLNFVAGRWIEAVGGEVYERRNPFDQSLVAIYQDSDKADVDLAVEAARHAFDAGPWPRMPAAERATVLHRAAYLLRERSELMADVMTREVGQPKGEMLKAIAGAAENLDYYAGLIQQRRDEAVAGQRLDALGLIIKEPIGVVGSLTAWNAPLSLVHKAFPGLAAGCTVVSKPAHQSAGAIIELARILKEAGLPDGAFNLITSAKANGAIVGQAIAAHSSIDMVTFTGSPNTGRAVMRAASDNLKRVKLELGGKSPNIVFADAPDLDHAAEVVVKGIFRLSGQSCQAGSRLLLQESVHEQFMELLVKHISAARLGDPFSPDTMCGPLVSEEQLKRVESFIAAGKESARLVHGGNRPHREDLKSGFFIEPTVFDQVAPDSRIAQEEAFGPVLSVITFKDTEDAIRIANNTAFGLVAGCWTRDLGTAMNVARAVRAGIVWINCYRDDSPLKFMPTGFRKQSGQGVEMGPEGLDAFLVTKSIMVKST